MTTWRGRILVGAIFVAGCDRSVTEDACAGDTARLFGCVRWSGSDPCRPRYRYPPPPGRDDAIRGRDDRLDLYCLNRPESGVHDRKEIRAAARASMAIFKEGTDLIEHDGVYRINPAHKPLADTPEPGHPEYRVCADEVFAQQDRGASCSGVAIAGSRLLSVRHCLDTDEPLLFVRGFEMGGPARPEKFTFKKHDVCHPGPRESLRCVGQACVIDIRCHGDEPVAAELAEAGPELHAEVYAVGYPSRLPAKFSGWGEVAEVAPDTFRVHADITPGNSGSPVFDHRHRVVGLINEDASLEFCRDRKSECRRWATCSACSGVTAITITSRLFRQEQDHDRHDQIVRAKRQPLHHDHQPNQPHPHDGP